MQCLLPFWANNFCAKKQVENTGSKFASHLEQSCDPDPDMDFSYIASRALVHLSATWEPTATILFPACSCQEENFLGCISAPWLKEQKPCGGCGERGALRPWNQLTTKILWRVLLIDYSFQCRSDDVSTGIFPEALLGDNSLSIDFSIGLDLSYHPKDIMISLRPPVVQITYWN